MKFCNYYSGSAVVAGVLLEGAVVPLYQLIPEIPGVSGAGNGKPQAIGTIDEGENNLVHLEQWRNAIEAVDPKMLSMSEHLELSGLRFAPPVLQPNSFRDFYAFEEHVSVARGRRDLEIVPEWYEIPVFYFSNHRSFMTHGDSLPFPAGGTWLDFELEIGAVITQPCNNLTLETARDAIGAYCVLNDWSLRDAQRQEMAVGLGPAKGKDFATGLGPWLVTADEIEPARKGKGFDLAMTAAINGEQVSAGNWSSIHYSFEEMLVRASQNVSLFPGDVIGSGTVGTGCILELGPEKTGGWLKSGDTVTLEIETLGLMSNKIVQA